MEQHPQKSGFLLSSLESTFSPSPGSFSFLLIFVRRCENLIAGPDFPCSLLGISLPWRLLSIQAALVKVQSGFF